MNVRGKHMYLTKIPFIYPQIVDSKWNQANLPKQITDYTSTSSFQ